MDSFGSPDSAASFPSPFNYTYDSSIFLYDSGPKSAYPRSYSEETRADKLDGCDACNDYSSVYYDPCHAKKNNECVGRQYPQCMKTYPHCPQLLENTPIEYRIPGTLREGFSNLGKGFKLNDKILLFLIIVCLVSIILHKRHKKKKRKVFAMTYGPNALGSPSLEDLYRL